MIMSYCTNSSRAVCVLLLTLLAAASVRADWDPSNGEWGKQDANDVRIMTYNIKDHICRTAVKSEGYYGWHALARIVAAMKPDVLIIQEAGDNSGNGTGSGVDSVAQLETTLDLFLYGGTDPFLGGTVEAYVQKYDASYDLPYVYVNSSTDGYNRNVILSRFDFTDLNGDTVSQRYDIGTVLQDAYVEQTGNGGIRGFMFAEFDLPDETYAGDLVIGNAHLKAYSSEWETRKLVAQRVAYYIDYLFNGAGTGIPDPNSKIIDSPAATTILDDNTVVVWGGDWNEDEDTNGRKGPAEWMTRAEYTGGTDGTDRDRTDSTYDSALEPRLGDRATIGSAKFDYIAWQDSIATLRNSFIFDSTAIGGATSWYPSEMLGFGGVSAISPTASDHLPVVVDLILPQDPCGGTALGDANCDGSVDNFDIDAFVLALTQPGVWQTTYSCDFLCANDCDDDGSVTNFDIDPFVDIIAGG